MMASGRSSSAGRYVIESPYLDTAAACLYLKRCREWLRQHRAAIGYCREPDGRITYRESDLAAYKARWYVPPPAEIGTVRRLPRRPVGSAGGTNRITGLPVGTPLTAAEAARLAPDARQRRSRR
jgi:hypothetical protein